MLIRKAIKSDIDGVEKIYSDIHTAEENGEMTIGWIRGVYPTRQTAEAALGRNDLYVLEDGGVIAGTGIINNIQAEEYKFGQWETEAEGGEVLVLHTLAILPSMRGKGYGRKLLDFYENMARQNGCVSLRIDTNARNKNARDMYRKLGYKETGEVPCDFNGIKGVSLVLLEKKL